MGIDLLKISAITEKYPNENWGGVFSTVATGLLVVFIILIILVFIFWAMGKIIVKATGGKKKKTIEVKIEAVPVQAAATTDEPEEEADNDEEIIAVISAAIAAYSASDGKQYRIASISKKREKNIRSNWSTAGIAENTRPF